jgi:hypothetical protein
MGLFNLRKNEPVQVVEVGGYQTFSTPFMKIPNGNLSLPFVSDRYQTMGYIPFGEDNLFPQYLNQMYYSSPLHGAIVDFKTNATVGGGYSFNDSALTAKEKVDLYAFGKKISISKMIKSITKDLIVHERVYFHLILKNGTVTKVRRISPDKVRISKCKTIYSVNDDWQYTRNIKTLTKYTPDSRDGEFIYVYECESLGQDYYPIPQYTSALNFVFLSGEMSYFAKSNIQNSVFPSFAMMFPKKPQGREEMELIKETVNKLKGAENAGKAVAFFANNQEQLPKIEAIPTNSNADLFKESSDLNTEQICFAHTIDPILLGVRTTGSLGNGSDIKQAYVIFEKNVILPLREMVTEIVDQLVKIAGIKTNVSITNYQIINDTILAVEDEGDSTMEALNSMSPLVATKVLEMMTINEVRALAGLPAVEGGDVTNTQAQAVSNKNIGI